ncbi:MAG TPA: hypothetical protein PLT75_01080 [Spirochaetota bacterium]|nr:hypothetical protein [Spirochaetota bacterium]
MTKVRRCGVHIYNFDITEMTYTFVMGAEVFCAYNDLNALSLRQKR